VAYKNIPQTVVR